MLQGEKTKSLMLSSLVIRGMEHRGLFLLMGPMTVGSSDLMFAPTRRLGPLDQVNGAPGHFQLDHDILDGHSLLQRFDEELSLGFHFCCCEFHNSNRGRWSLMLQCSCNY